MSKKTISLAFLANQLGVSPSTVSRALSGHSAISESMIAAVRKLADELNYTPNQMAIGLKSGRRNAIAVIVPTISRHFFASVIEGIEDYAHSEGFDILICQSKNSLEVEKKLVKSLRGKVDGVIASMAAEQGSHAHYNELSVPIVMFDRVDAQVKGSSVTIDDRQGAFDATNHLLAQGLKKIYHFSGPRHVTIWENRCGGYMDAMKSAGVEVPNEWIYEAYTTEDEGRKFAKQIIKSGDFPEAIFFSGDYAALGATMEFKRCDIDIPIVGFANEPFCTFIDPPLTSVNQFSARMGGVACKLLIDIINGQPAFNTVIAPQLVVRNSSLKR